jgi:hypothetical protein
MKHRKQQSPSPSPSFHVAGLILRWQRLRRMMPAVTLFDPFV